MWLAGKLNRRVQIQTPNQDDNVVGGFDRSYTTIATVWMAITNPNAYIQAVRGANTRESKEITHVFQCRQAAVKELGNNFTKAFDANFNSIYDLYTVKSKYFLFVQNESNIHGRLFRIISVARDEKHKSWVKMETQEVEEKGTGYGS